MDYHPQKGDPYQTCVTVGGNLINCPGDVGITTANMVVSKFLFDSVMLASYAKFMGIHIKNFYFNTSMALYEDMEISIDIILQEVVNEYHIVDKVKMASSCVKYDS